MGKQGKEFGIGKKGKIGITLEKPHYIAGELVRGTIYASIYEPIVCDAVVLKATGKEKVEFVTSRTNSEGEREKEEHDAEKVFFKDKIVISTVAHTLNPGNYMYQFEYQLPPALPGVFHMDNYSGNDVRDLKAKIKYKFKATLDVEGFFAKDLKADYHVVVHSQLWHTFSPSEDSTTQSVRYLCCFDKGTCQLSVAMDKNAYLPGETAQIMCHIQNNSEVEIRAMNCHLWQDIHVTDGRNHQSISLNVNKHEFPGVPAHQTIQQPQPLPLVPKFGFLNPSTHGSLVSCSYRIEVECDIPMCPDVTLHLPVTILAPPFQTMCWVPESTDGFIAG